ncbi:porin [Acidisoma cellulosilytica]|uniref:Porin n=1 Tax=Acidisoma cellulosilyticum TaxID=2802395 RepID=A0A964E3Z8_9PROT|nr:porin [Acidisoma cellulosilyticum]MCB8881175.1 porin [Acidisoma cellulosilyticum]
MRYEIGSFSHRKSARRFLLAGFAASAAAIGLAGNAQAQSTNPDFTKTLAPGSIVVRLDGRVSAWAGVDGFTGQSYNGTKYSGFSTAGYLRLYPGFDGVAANGLQYGAQAEIRENTETSAAAGASSETLYVLRDFGYLGLPQLGLVRFGQQEGALYLNDAGRFESGKEAFDSGGWNGDVQNFFVNTSARPIYPWTWSNSTRTTDKIDYITPSFSGLSFSVSFEPNQTGENYAPAVTSTTTATDLRRNTVEIGTTYKAKFDGVGLIVDGGYMNAGAVGYTGTAKAGLPYQGMSVGSAGATLSYAGFTVGGNTKFGNMNGQFEPNYAGGANAVGWLAGGLYTAGQLTVGASYFNYKSQGDYSSPKTEGQRDETGLAAGATYVLVPGVKLFASYLYGTRWQGGYNFLSGAAGSANNKVQAQVFALGTWLYW